MRCLQFVGAAAIMFIAAANASAQSVGNTTAAGAIPLNYSPDFINVNRVSNTLYVSEPATATQPAHSASFVLVDATNHSTKQTVPGAIYARAVSERLNRFYEPTDDGQAVIEFDGATGQQLSSIGLSRHLATAIAVDDTRRVIWAAASILGSNKFGGVAYYIYLTPINIDTHAVGTTVLLNLEQSPGLSAVAVDNVSGQVTVESAYALYIYDPSNGGHATPFPASGQTPDALAIDSSAGLVIADYTGTDGTHHLYAFNETTGDIVAAFDSITSDEGTIAGIAADPVTHTVYVVTSGTNTTASSLFVYDGTNNYGRVGRFTLDAAATSIVFDSANRQLFIAMGSANKIAVFQNMVAAPAPQLANISSRANVASGDSVLIAGFIVSGSQPKKVMVRAIGPSLSKAGVANALRDPTLELHDADGKVLHNDDWQTTVASDFGSEQASAIAASGLPPNDAHESAMIVQLSPGTYTAVVDGKGDSGVGLVEVYDLDPANGELANISTRGLVQTADNVMIAGVIVTGALPSRVAIRALGPSLASSRVTNVLADPTLELHDPNGALVQANDDWQANADELNAANLAPSNQHESGMVAFLSPGNYTAIVRDANNTTGIALVEAYHLKLPAN